MRKERTLLIIGIIVMILPFLGFPNNWRKIFFVIIGFALVYLSYLFYKQVKARQPNNNQSKTFVDNIGSGE